MNSNTFIDENDKMPFDFWSVCLPTNVFQYFEENLDGQPSNQRTMSGNSVLNIRSRGVKRNGKNVVVIDTKRNKDDLKGFSRKCHNYVKICFCNMKTIPLCYYWKKKKETVI